MTVATPNHRGADCEDSVIKKILKTYKNAMADTRCGLVIFFLADVMESLLPASRMLSLTRVALLGPRGEHFLS